eukprot:m.335960 g.335960  ORF g.335960 m.335960 type:complete len:404 (+) comp17723_c0_seq1:82-1293(+)
MLRSSCFVVAAVVSCVILQVKAVDPTCAEFWFESMCNAADTPGDCHWCDYKQPGNTQCLPKNETCKGRVIAQKYLDMGIRANHTYGEIQAILKKHDPEHFPVNSRERRQTTARHLEGLFIRPCQSYGTTPDGKPVSQVDTRRYYHVSSTATEGQYELDRTYYAGDANCVPNDSDIFFKLNLHGNISYYGKADPSVEPIGWKAKMHWNGAQIYVKDNYYTYVQSDLKKCCPKLEFKTNTWLTVDSSQCNIENSNTNLPQICYLVGGATDYFLYNWTDPMHYVTSRDDFDPLEGWNNHISTGYLRTLIQESGNNDPDDCTPLLWGECKESILEAKTNCKSCGSDGGGDSDLECEGCVFREMCPPTGPHAWDPYSMNNWWQRCCPCIANYAENVELSWLKASVNHC